MIFVEILHPKQKDYISVIAYKTKDANNLKAPINQSSVWQYSGNINLDLQGVLGDFNINGLCSAAIAPYSLLEENNIPYSQNHRIPLLGKKRRP